MSDKRADRADHDDREGGIADLEGQGAGAAGGKGMSSQAGAVTNGEWEDFCRRMDAFENGPFTTDFERLTATGLELPPPEAIDDAHLPAKLWEVVRALAEMRIFLSETDHLSDRELYSHLWHETLRQEVPVEDAGFTSHVGLVSTGSEENIYLYLKYYADDDERRDWLAEFPDYAMPAHEDPPYSRDRLLPEPTY